MSGQDRHCAAMAATVPRPLPSWRPAPPPAGAAAPAPPRAMVHPRCGGPLGTARPGPGPTQPRHS
eukprot:2943993-Prymnesium_polylepis.1